MKKLIILLLILCNCSTAYLQDLVEVNRNLILANDSLQRQVISPLQDNISRLNTAVINLNRQIEKLEKDTTNLNKKIRNLETRRVTAERDELRVQIRALIVDTTELNRKILEQEKQIEIIRQDRYAEGQQNVYHQIVQTYNRSFDELISFSTKQSVERDLSLVANNETAKKKLQNLQKYFTAKQILSERFNEQSVNVALNEIRDIEQSQLVKNLVEKLEDYKSYNDVLRMRINNIIDIDKRFTGGDCDDSQSRKLQHILLDLSWYFRNYPNFTEYPYLSDIILEIMRRKQGNADRPIDDLLRKL